MNQNIIITEKYNKECTNKTIKAMIIIIIIIIKYIIHQSK